MDSQPTTKEQPTTKYARPAKNDGKPTTNNGKGKGNWVERLKEHRLTVAFLLLSAILGAAVVITGAPITIRDNINKYLSEPSFNQAILTAAVVITGAPITIRDIKGYWSNLSFNQPNTSFKITGVLIRKSGVSVPKRLGVTVNWRLNRSNVIGSWGTGTVDSSMSYNLPLSEPPDEVLMESEGAKVGVGSIVAFSDANGNGGRELLGASEDVVLTYLGGDLTSITATKLSLPKGYSLTKVAASKEDTVLEVVSSNEEVNIILAPDKKQTETSDAAVLLFKILEDVRRRKLGQLVIDTERSVSVTVNDTLRSKRILYLTPGPNEVVLKHPRYGQHSKTVVIKQGQKTELKCRFEHLISVTTEPYLGSAVVFLDGETTNIQGAGKLTVGPQKSHRVDVRLAGYRVSRHRIDGLEWKIGSPDPFRFRECLPTKKRVRITFTLTPL